MTTNTLPTSGLEACEAALCAHCGLPVPAGLLQADAAQQFCCSGCRAVYAVIHQCGLTQYYRMREAQGAAPRAARQSTRRFQEFDDPAFAALYVRTRPDGLHTAELFLEGVHCGACVWLVERLPRVAAGVIEARLNFRRALVRLVWDPQRVRLSQAARALDTLGYVPHAARDATARTLQQREERRLLLRIAVAGAAAGNAMLLAFALYAGSASGMERVYEQLFRWLSLLVGAVSLVWPGSTFFRGAIAALRTRTAHLDLPIALALAAGGVAGAVNTLLNRGEIYFDSLCMLVFLLLVGRWFQRRQQQQAADAVELLFSLTPGAVQRVEPDGAVKDVPIEAVRPGDLIQVRASDTIAVDGRIERGQSSIDRSLLTGESEPQEVGVGDSVCAGTLNLASPLHVRTEAAGAATRVGKLMELVERCAKQAAPVAQFADRLAGRLTLTMLALASLTLGIWLNIRPEHAVDHATALLLVTCPCALGLATPLILTVAIGRAARRGAMVKGGVVFESLARGGTIWLDKTGTLTEARLHLSAWIDLRSAAHTAGSARPDTQSAWLKSAVTALERQSLHPIARGFCRAAGKLAAPEFTHEVRDVRQHLGGGIEGRIDGQRVCVGSAAFVATRGVEISDALQQRIREAAASAQTPVLITLNDQPAALACMQDSVRPDARAAVQQLRARGWQVGILSGDNPHVVRCVAQALQIEPERARGGVSPEEKLAQVQASRTHAAHTVVMVGDGVNDAAALSAASVGIAVHGGAEASLAAAHVYLNRPGLAAIVELIDAGRRVFRTIRQAMLISLSYNAVAAALALTGVLTPLMAAILMPISSFSVLTLALSSPTFVAAAARRGETCP